MTAGHRSRSSNTKQRLLDAAEQLFAERGFKRTSISALARKARVNQAAVNYHFGSKAALVEQVIERRSSTIGCLRMERLQAVRERAARTGIPPDIDALLDAFVAPAFLLIDGEKRGKYFMLLANRAFSEPDETIQNIFVNEFAPSFRLFIELMRAALPDLSETELHWRLQFVIGAMAHAMHVCGGQLPESDIFPAAENPDRLLKRLLAFLAAGLRAPVAAS